MRRVKSEGGAARKARTRTQIKWLSAALRPRNLISGAALLVLAGFGAGAAWIWESGTATRTLAGAQERLLSLSADMGLSVREVLVEGRKETAKSDLIDALGVKVGQPTLAFDPKAAQMAVESLGWVRSAAVERKLPGIVHVRIQERAAVAIWQREGRFVLIDAEGVEIGEKDVGRHGHLKVVVGPDAPLHVVDLLATLRTEDELSNRVIAAVRVGERRWNLRLDSGIDVRLPEDDMLGAWRRLAGLERDHGILARAIEAIDLRQPDRLIVRMTEEGAAEIQLRHLRHSDGEDT